MFNIISNELEATGMSEVVSPPPFSAPMRIEVTKGPKLRSGIPIISGFMPAGALIPGNYIIPHHDPRTKNGYQRLPQDARINELALDLKKNRVDLPTAILINIRDRAAKESIQNGFLDVKFSDELMNTVAKFYVVDGQHRILALEKLIFEEENKDKWRSYMLPFVCMLGATEEQEMDQFYIVNSKAKSVRTDLAYELLKQRAENDPSVLSALIEKGKDWQVTAQEISEELAARSPVWRDRIRFAAMEKDKTTLSSTSMVSSLKPLLSSPFFKMLSRDKQVELLDAFWRGLRNFMMDAFDNPEKYTIQKGLGVVVLHMILVQVIEVVRSNGWSVTEAESYEKVMREPLSRLQGDNASGDVVLGIDFWKTAPEGAAGTHSSSAGRRVLIAKLQSQLPRLSIS
ncbi:MAG: DGQHR domain-containing protein [Aurantimonas endophytica]|uniref:DGQHR domain-containing protein n=1 Tax=Aurantimonas endophytica TaxID=1522175 RepID=UPI003001D98C